MKHKKGRFGLMLLNIDLEKTYDKLEWDFIRKVIELYKFPFNLISLIMDCITSTSISILLNGGKMKTFKPQHGFKQGDPLSFYILIMCMQFLRALIHQESEHKDWIPIKTSKYGPSFSHFFFVNGCNFKGRFSTIMNVTQLCLV